MPAIRRAGRRIAFGVCALALGVRAAAAAPAPADTSAVLGPLTLAKALQLAASRAPDVTASDLRAQAAADRVRDAGRLTNPVFAFDEENFGGALGGRYRETTLSLGQTFELGGDRGARAAVATGERDAAASEAASLRRERAGLVAERFIRAWALQERLARQAGSEVLAREAIAAADARHRAGASPVVERTRAESQALTLSLAQRVTASDLAIARLDLAAAWGGSSATFETLVADALEESRERTAVSLDGHPDLRRAGAHEALAGARIRAAEAARVPDVTITAGARRIEDADGTGFVAGLSLPLPLWTNGGGHLDALHGELEASRTETRLVRQRLETGRAIAAGRVAAASAVYDTLRLRIAPARRRLVDELMTSYRAGRLSYLDLVAEQQNLLDTDLALVEARAELWLSRVRLALLEGAAPTTEDDR